VSQKLRVAIVTESFLPSVNGVTNSILRILDTFKQQGHEALIIAPTKPNANGSNSAEITHTHYLGFEVIKTASVPVMQFPMAIPGLWLQEALEEFAPDVIHVAAPFMLGGQAIAAANRLGIPAVAIYQTDLSGYMDRYNLSFARPLLDKLVQAIHTPATLNLAPTPEGASYLNALGVPKVDVWGRGVDLDLYHPNHKFSDEVKALKTSIAPNGEAIIGYVGRIAAEKQVQRFAELFEIPNTKFVIVGDGPERARLEQEFAGHPVTFTGKLNGLKLAHMYAAFDTFVHFGTEETFGQTIQEAQATGLPVVAPESGGPRFLINSNETGFLAHPTEKFGFNQPVAELAANPQLRARIGENARRAVLNKSWEANNARLIEHYRDAIAGNQQLTGASNTEASRLELA
jgi:phosphatidylinositol alpha 1,6-mannosyltransferase